MPRSIEYWTECVGPGWRNLVECTVNTVHELGGEIQQVKEKFGALRIYTFGGAQEQIQDVVMKAETASQSICEECGASGKPVDIGGWLKTLCEEHV